jgi:hypothetical protein
VSSDSPKKPDPEASAPVDIAALDSSWDDDDLDEDATMVAKIPRNLVELSRMKDPEKAPPREEAEPEKHEAITARPPPMGAEPSVVVDAPHETLAAEEKDATEAVEEEDDEDDEEEDDAAEGDEEARARAADEAAGLDVDARRKAIEERTSLRREKARAKTLAAKERRKARQEDQRLKQKKPKKRSLPPRAAGEKADRTSAVPASTPATGAATKTKTDPPAAPDKKRTSLAAPKTDWMRMVLLVAVVILLGAVVIGLARL